MKLGVVRETLPGERRVAAVPATVRRFAGLGFEVWVEKDAGSAAGYSDDAYREAGAKLVDTAEAWTQADVVLKIRAPRQLGDGNFESDGMHRGQTLICQLYPVQNKALVERLGAQGIHALALDCVPRITRAQKMDTLSSMANITGYRAVIEASTQYGRFFTGQMTAAGKVAPARVLIIGAGVAGLAALGAAKALGAQVRAFDTRAAAKEQVESLGGEFLTVTIQESGEGGGGYAKEMSKEFIDAEMALFRQQAPEVDVVITTALIPGKPAPKLWLADMVEKMKPGSVVIDLAAEQGGNCDLTRANEVVVHHGVKVVGYTDYTSRMASVASEMFGNNLGHFLEELGGANKFALDHGNEVIRGALVLEGGELRYPPPAPAAAQATAKGASADAKASTGSAGAQASSPAVAAAVPPPSRTASGSTPPPARTGGHGHGGGSPQPLSPNAQVAVNVLGVAAAAVWLILRFAKPDAMVGSDGFVRQLTIFVLAIFVGWQVIWNVAPALHTPLMSVTNAISGIIIIGGFFAGALHDGGLPLLLAVAATFFATINIAGGFLVTRRMLAMFRK